MAREDNANMLLKQLRQQQKERLKKMRELRKQIELLEKEAQQRELISKEQGKLKSLMSQLHPTRAQKLERALEIGAKDFGKIINAFVRAHKNIHKGNVRLPPGLIRYKETKKK